GKSSSRKVAQNQSAPKTQSVPSTGTAENPSSDKIDVSDLENKYWAAKDTDFNVVQNRLYSKANRFAFSGMYGTFVNDPWSEGGTVALSTNYFFSERYGAELIYAMSDSKDTQATKNLKANNGGTPNH